MRQRHVRSFSAPDEVIEAQRVRSEIVTLFGMTVSRDTHMPGWRWSEDVRPVVHTEFCEVRHIGYAVRGELHVVLDDHSEFDVRAGEVYHIPPRHEGWVVGDTPFEVIEWVGSRSWISPVGIYAGRVLATIAVTDIVESTGAAQKMGDHAWKEMLAIYESRARDVITMFRGRVIKMTGDGVLATFDGTARAVRSALTLRDVASDLGARTRVAVHTGEVELTANDVHGLTVNEATRMLDVAGPDEVLVSAATQALSSDPGLEFTDHGDYQLRGIEGVRRLYRVTERHT